MREQFGDWWQMYADARCITTNGFIKKDGTGVMGAGTAGQAQMRWPYFPEILGERLKDGGNHVQIMEYEEDSLFHGKSVAYLMFPVKHVWYEDASLDLIKRSVDELIVLADQHEAWQEILLPRPGCGNGNLMWEEVKPLVEVLDHRFVVVDR